MIIAGAGIGGLSAALELSRTGRPVIVCETRDAPGGKMREVSAGGAAIDAGPTVFTMRWVFDEIFASAGTTLECRVTLDPLDILARHVWSDGSTLDLFADLQQSRAAIAQFASESEAQGFIDFYARARDVYNTLERPFMRSEQPTPVSLALGSGLKGLAGMMRISPFTTLWQALGDHFKDPRLRQLFGRYATYCGSSPFEAPATLMLVAHVEAQGVWSVRGGMQKLAEAMAQLATERGADLRYATSVVQIKTDARGVRSVELSSGELIETDCVIVNADAAAVAAGFFGPDIAKTVPQRSPQHRSLSAVTWACNAVTRGFPLERHNVFFSQDYQAEFDEILKRRRLPSQPTIYVCAQDRGPGARIAPGEPERLLILVNAPADGDTSHFKVAGLEQCEQATFRRLEQLGLKIERNGACIRTSPEDFAKLFPATGGALYGQASHGWAASFNRPAARTRLRGLYLAGGSVHPGPGVPMAALSGRIAAQCLLKDQIF